MAAYGIRVTSASGALTVTITGPNGGTPHVYSDEALTAAVSLPATVADATSSTFYVASPGTYTLSVKTAGGTEIAAAGNTTRNVDLESAGTVAKYSYDTRLYAAVSGDSGSSAAASTGGGGTGTTTYVVATGTGIDPTGVADSTTALQAILDAASGAVFLPAGDYSITHLTIPDHVTLLGTSSRRYSGTTVGGSRLLCSSAVQTTAVVTMNVRSQLVTTTVVGASSSHDVILLAGTSPTVRGCTITGGSSGIQGNVSGTYCSGALISGNNIYGNAASGIIDVVDSLIQNNWINTNTTGVNGQAGANDNSIVGNKIEWNTNVNISLVSCLNTTIVGNVLDRASNEGIRLDTCTAVVVTGNVIRRNGATTVDATRNCHVRLNNCTACQVFGNVTAHGKNDDATGNDTPTNVIYGISNTDCRTANNGVGCTGATLNNGGSNTRTGYDGDAEDVIASSGAALTLLDPSRATVHRVTLDANCTLTFPTPIRGQSLTLVLVQDATGSRTVTWPGTAKWGAAGAPTLSTAATKADYLTFTCTDGTNWDGFVVGKGF